MTPDHTVWLSYSLALPAVALAPSQKFYLADMLPKAPYLTRLDAYIYISFLTIVAIFVANCIVLVVQDYQQLTNATEPCPSLSTTDKHGYCVYPSLLLSLGEGNEAPAFAADFVDKLLLFVIASVFVVTNIDNAWKCYKDIKRMRYENATRVQSDEDKAGFKEHPNPKGKCNTFTPFLFNQFCTAPTAVLVVLMVCCFPPLGSPTDPYKKQLKRHGERFEMARKACAENVEKAGIASGMSTVHLRRAHYVDLQKKVIETTNFLSLIEPKQTTHCDCEACWRRRNPVVGPNVKLETFFESAGIVLRKQTALCQQFSSYRMDYDDLTRIFNKGRGADTLDGMLKEIEVPLEERAKLLGALTEAKKLDPRPFTDGLCALQGSSSYLIIALGWSGKLIKTQDFKDRLAAELAKRTTDNVDSEGKPWDFGDTANMLFASCLFSSKLLTSEYIYSQRSFDAKDESAKISVTVKGKSKVVSKWQLPSQVWLGYLEDVSLTRRKLWNPTQANPGAIAVDLGTGKLAFGYAEKLPGGRIRAVDLTAFEVSGKAIEQFFKDLTKLASYMDVNHKSNDIPLAGVMNAEARTQWEAEHNRTDSDQLEEICKAFADGIKGVREYLTNTAQITLTGNEPILFFGTSKLRQWIKKNELDHGGACSELITGLGAFVQGLINQMPLNGRSSNHTVNFEVIAQKKEARCENLAFKLALKYGKLGEENEAKQKIIETLLKNDKVGNIAWGNGSMQGYPEDETYVCAEMGMTVAKAQLKKAVKTAIVDPKAKKPQVVLSFSDDDLAAPTQPNGKTKAAAAIHKARQLVIEQMESLAPRMPVPKEPAALPTPDRVAAYFAAEAAAAAADKQAIEAQKNTTMKLGGGLGGFIEA